MKYSDFLSQIVLLMKDRLGKDAEVSVRPVLKNNDCRLDSLLIIFPGENISPSIYLNDYYTKYLQGASLEEILCEIEHFYRTYRCPVTIDTSVFEDFSYVRKQLFLRVINRSSNEALLEDVPYIPFLDLAVVFYLDIHSDYIGHSSTLVHNSHLSLWNISEDMLFYEAYSNTHSQAEPTITTMPEMLTGLLRESGSDIPGAPYHEKDSSLYVLTTKSCLFGAACLLFKDVLSDFSFRIGEDFYILPSSIHELLLIGVSQSPPEEELIEMVREINHTVVKPEEFLSDNIYCFHGETGVVEVIP